MNGPENSDDEPNDRFSELLKAGAMIFEKQNREENELNLHYSPTNADFDLFGDDLLDEPKSLGTKRTRADSPTVSNKTNHLPSKKLHYSNSSNLTLNKKKLLAFKPNTEFISTSSHLQTFYTRLAPLSDLMGSSTVRTNKPLLSKPIDEILENAFNLQTKAQKKTDNLVNFDTEQLLWIEKYAPTTFFHLLSDDKTNREVLSWLKEWETFLKRSKQANCPEQISLILSGPSGSGKSVLAQVCAEQSGFNPICFNVSLSNGKEEFIRRVSDAISFQQLFSDGKFEKKPSCIIIEELDAVTPSEAKGIVEFFEKMITQKTTTKSSTRKKSLSLLKRPLIFTCNDPFVSHLRNIRKFSKVYYLKRLNSSRVVERLKGISLTEKLNIDSSSLFSLWEQTNGDIRSCLNSLQLMRGVNTNKQSMKDFELSVYDVWNAVFENDKETLRHADAHDSTVINDGLFQNYLGMKQSSIVGNSNAPFLYCSEWFSCADSSSSFLDSQLAYALSFSFALSKQTQKLFATNFPYPRLSYLMKKHTQDLREVLKASSSSYCRNKGTLSHNHIATEILPYLCHILTPSLRNVHFALLSSDEKSRVTRLAELHSSFQILYIKQNEQGAESFALEPPLNSICDFSFDANIKSFLSHPFFSKTETDLGDTYTTKAEQSQTVAKIELPKLTASHKQAIMNEVNAIVAQKKLAQLAGRQDVIKRERAILIADQTKKLFPKMKSQPTTTEEKKGKLDFFGREIPSMPSKENTQPKKARTVHYKYQEGFTNAIKRKAYVKDFL